MWDHLMDDQLVGWMVVSKVDGRDALLGLWRVESWVEQKDGGKALQKVVVTEQ